MGIAGKKTHLHVVGNQELGAGVNHKLSPGNHNPQTHPLPRKQWWHLLSLVGSWLLEKNLEVPFPFLFMFPPAIPDLPINFSFFSQLYHPHGCNTPQLLLCQHFQSILLKPFNALVQTLHSQFSISTWLCLNQAQLYMKLKNKIWPLILEKAPHLHSQCSHHNKKTPQQQQAKKSPARLQRDFTSVWVFSWHCCIK